MTRIARESSIDVNPYSTTVYDYLKIVGTNGIWFALMSFIESKRH